MSFLYTGVKHSFWRGPWRYCGVCDLKTHIDEMNWQRGTLKCKKCFDEWPLPGQREIAIAAVITDGKQERELTPVEKLRNPTEYMEPEDFVL